MSIFSRTAAVPTLEERSASAAALASAAVSVFEQAATDLTIAAEEHAEIEREAFAEIERLSGVAADAFASAEAARTRSARLRYLADVAL